MKKLTIATCQHDVCGEIKVNLYAIRNLMKRAGLQGADIIHFPETSLSGYAGVDFPLIRKKDNEQLQVALSNICELAGHLRLWVIIGSHHFEEGIKKPFNSLYVINDRGKIAHRYDKRLLTNYGDELDVNHYMPGKEPVVFNLNGIKCGLLICHEWRYPELYREYYKKKAKVIFQSWYDGNHSKSEYEKSGKYLGELIPGTVRGNAANNHMWISGSNTSRKESNFPAFIIRPDGRIHNKLKRNKQGVLISRIDVEQEYYDPSRPWRDRVMKGIYTSGKMQS